MCVAAMGWQGVCAYISRYPIGRWDREYGDGEDLAHMGLAWVCAGPTLHAEETRLLHT